MSSRRPIEQALAGADLGQAQEAIDRQGAESGNSASSMSVGDDQSKSRWIGSIPSPETFAEYERVMPGMSEIILRNWTDESTHRRERERVSDDRKHQLAWRGQVLSLLGAGGLSLIGYSVYLDRPLQPQLMWSVAALIAAMAGRAFLPLLRGGGEDAKREPPLKELEGR